MDETQFLQFSRESVLVMLTVASPVMLIGLVVGLAVAIFQALTSIQEMSLTFVPKILAVFVSLIVLLPFMFETMTKYMEGIVDRIVGIS
ncbi:MAG: flagellar biosynthesis protein FliQ [Pseudomonadota bacterium]|nr:flagellar biosynthesis protein FliQ [Pseudomonadota bacterium]|tara:strand:- start:133 stop:399 length:267 start_codon:yes stop_codon:yes gene_type:complete